MKIYTEVIYFPNVFMFHLYDLKLCFGSCKSQTFDLVITSLVFLVNYLKYSSSAKKCDFAGALTIVRR